MLNRRTKKLVPNAPSPHSKMLAKNEIVFCSQNMPKLIDAIRKMKKMSLIFVFRRLKESKKNKIAP